MRPFRYITIGILLALVPALFAACGSTTTTSSTQTPLAAPETLSVEPVVGDDTALEIQWSAVKGAVSYNLYVSTTTPVDPDTADLRPNVFPPLKLTGLAADQYFYFAVTAVYPEGESKLSDEVGTELVAEAPDVPQGVTAFNTPEVTNSITIQWWDVVGAAGYNIYRGTEAGLATYYTDPAKAKKTPNALAPYIDTDDIVGGTTYYYVVTSFDADGHESAPSAEASVMARGKRMPDMGGGEGGGEDDTGYGNNLSFPVVFADNVGITGLRITGVWPGVVTPSTPVPAFDFNTGLRPLSTEVLPEFPYFEDNTSVLMGGVTYYPQATASTWQAEWRANPGGDNLSVIVDWGDALASKTYTTNSVVRIETVLFQDAPIVSDTMAAFNMTLLAGSGATELQGTDTTTYASAKRNVFVVNARLIIQKLALDNATVECEVYNNSVWESLAASEEGEEGGGGGSGAYAGEMNVGGSLVYGYNFMINTLNMAQACSNGSLSKTGTWKILFQLDETATIGSEEIPNHVRIIDKSDATAVIDDVDGKWSYILISVQ